MKIQKHTEKKEKWAAATPLQFLSEAAYWIPNCDHVVIRGLGHVPFKKTPERERRQLRQMRVERAWDSRRKLPWHLFPRP